MDINITPGEHAIFDFVFEADNLSVYISTNESVLIEEIFEYKDIFLQVYDKDANGVYFVTNLTRESIVRLPKSATLSSRSSSTTISYTDYTIIDTVDLTGYKLQFVMLDSNDNLILNSSYLDLNYEDATQIITSNPQKGEVTYKIKPNTTTKLNPGEYRSSIRLKNINKKIESSPIKIKITENYISEPQPLYD